MIKILPFKIRFYSQLHELLFGYFFYQFHNMVMCASAYFTMVLAFERFRAVCNPVNYYNSVNTCQHLWRRAILWYVTPVVIVSVLFNFPKFFETQFESEAAVQEILDHNNTVIETVRKKNPRDRPVKKEKVFFFAKKWRKPRIFQLLWFTVKSIVWQI